MVEYLQVSLKRRLGVVLLIEGKEVLCKIVHGRGKHRLLHHDKINSTHRPEKEVKRLEELKVMENASRLELIPQVVVKEIKGGRFAKGFSYFESGLQEYSPLRSWNGKVVLSEEVTLKSVIICFLIIKTEMRL